MSFFDLQVTEEDADVVITPVPWDVTTSYGQGTRLGPEAIRMASSQIDHFNFDTDSSFQHKYFLRAGSDEILKRSESLRNSISYILNQETDRSESDKSLIDNVNLESDKLNNWVYTHTKNTIDNAKIPGSLGGDHSIPFGAIQAVAESVDSNYAILHIDAHHDFRNAYLGFTHSHASIFYNIMESSFQPKSLVQIGIRDFCQEEFDYANDKENIHVYYDRIVKNEVMSGQKNWLEVATEAIAKLDSENVYISLDIDGFDPKLCPNTGTPVPGGIDFDHFILLLKQIISQNKKIIGFDLVEVAPDSDNPKNEWDANVGMRVLFELCKFSVLSQK